MRPPTEYEIEHLLHYAIGYDPVAAKKYYEEHKQLKGRKRGGTKITEDDPRWNPKTMGNKRGSLTDPRTGKTRDQIAKEARTRQRKELTDRIGSLTKKLDKLKALIKERESKEKSENRKSTAKKERAAKDKDKPDTAAEKAQASRDSEKYRDEHKQELKTKSKSDSKKSDGGSDSGSKKKTGGKHATTSELRSLATKVTGQIAVAKQKLAAL